ncbi:hypothetical protein KUTeg_012171 [Tegillarca granosa]|uniref:Uncharacterized protein n=1 Tax=Tegillarca granosa TaxID=220873 RepID=A0ABQ9F167_TEGGR|nr:hypothetical protein KUTeg_012171 [Tegillarca granosa]
MFEIRINGITYLMKSLLLFMLSLDIYFDVWADGAGSQEVEQHLEMGNKLLAAGQLADALSHYHAAVVIVLLQMEILARMQRANVLLKQGKLQEAEEDYSEVICPWDPEFREIRAECYIAQGEFFKAIGDIRPTTKLRNDNTKGFYKLSLLHYDIGDADESLK